MIDLDAVARAEVTREPFTFFTAAGVLDPDALSAIRADMPEIGSPGIFPLAALSYGPAFARLVDDIHSPALRELLSAKFDIDLDGKPLMITVRGRAHPKDGRIHTDSTTKVVTCLLYLNEAWDESDGRLRLLRGPEDLDDYIAEIPPHGGTLASFVRADNSWHGHAPFVGDRRYVMFNWMTSDAARDRELARHRMSARLKRVKRLAWRRGEAQ